MIGYPPPDAFTLRKLVEYQATRLARVFLDLDPSARRLRSCVEALLDHLDPRPVAHPGRQYRVTAFGLLRLGLVESPYLDVTQTVLGPTREYCHGTRKWCQYEPAGDTPQAIAERVLTDLAADALALLACPGPLSSLYAQADLYPDSRAFWVRVGAAVVPQGPPELTGEKC